MSKFKITVLTESGLSDDLCEVTTDDDCLVEAKPLCAAIEEAGYTFASGDCIRIDVEDA